MSRGLDLKDNLTALVEVAVDLADSVKEDIKEQRHVSDETILQLSKFYKLHTELDTILDIINGIN